MPRRFTVADLVLRCQQRAEMEGQDFVTDAEWKGYLSTAYAELFSILAATGMRYFESVETIATDGSASYALPSDFLSAIGVDYVVNASTGERRQLREQMVQERNLYTGLTGSSEAEQYAIVGANVKLSPTPPTGQTYELVYVPQPVDLSSAQDATEVDVVTPDGEAFLLWYVAVLALSKEKSDVQVAMAERARARERLETWATLRALNTPRRHIVDGCDDGYGYEVGDYRRSRW